MEQATVPVCIFAKPPLPGKVKTRLIPYLGVDAAASLASAMLSDVWRAAHLCPGVRPVLASAEAGEFSLDVPEQDIWLQGDGGLGERLERILIRALESAPAVIALGADSPLVEPKHIDVALRALEVYDAAIGPSADGGFYLLALKRCFPGLLHDLPWSCAETFSATKNQLEQHGLSVESITPLFDVDTPEDLALLVSALAENSELAPATRAWCEQRALRCA